MFCLVFACLLVRPPATPFPRSSMVSRTVISRHGLLLLPHSSTNTMVCPAHASAAAASSWLPPPVLDIVYDALPHCCECIDCYDAQRASL